MKLLARFRAALESRERTAQKFSSNTPGLGYRLRPHQPGSLLLVQATPARCMLRQYYPQHSPAHPANGWEWPVT